MDPILALILDQQFSVSIPFELNGVKGTATFKRKPTEEVKSVSFTGSKQIQIGSEVIIASLEADYSLETNRWNFGPSKNFSRTDFDATLAACATYASSIKTAVSDNLIFVADV